MKTFEYYLNKVKQTKILENTNNNFELIKETDSALLLKKNNELYCHIYFDTVKDYVDYGVEEFLEKEFIGIEKDYERGELDIHEKYEYIFPDSDIIINIVNTLNYSEMVSVTGDGPLVFLYKYNEITHDFFEPDFKEFL